MTYNWTTDFNLTDALNGTLVGFPVANKNYDLSNTGTLVGPGPIYTVKFGGYALKVQKDGTVSDVTPSNATWLNQKLQMVTVVMGDEGAVGSSVTRSSGSSGTGHDDTAVLSNIEPRDQFAVQVLNAMLIHTDHPEAFNDARCLMYSRAAYRWAQAMMIAAADSREGQADSSQSQTTVEINSADLQSNSERLLYNISEYLKNGIAVKGTSELGASPIQTKITEVAQLPNVNIGSMPSVSISGTPTVIVNGLDSITDSFEVPNRGTIYIKTGIFNETYIRFEVQSYMTYSDVSVYLELSVSEGMATATRKVGHIIPKGSVVTLMALDDAVTGITSITSKSVRGKGGGDPNSYSLTS